MNALVSLDSILEPAPGTLTPANLFGTGAVEALLTAIETNVRGEVFTLDTDEGRERIKSVAYKIARSKTTLDDIGKEHVADIKAKAGAIDAERRTIRERLDALKESVRGPLTAWEEAEAHRIDGHERAIVFIVTSPREGFSPNPPTHHIRERIAAVRETCRRDWQEFHERGEAAATDALATLETMLAAAEQAERDAAELTELRALKAERDARDVAEAQAKAKAEAEAKATAEAAERERLRAEQATREKAEQEARAKAQAEEAAARAVEVERKRVAAVKAAQAQAERKRQEDEAHRSKVHGQITAALLAEGIAADTADQVLNAIAAGRIDNVSITY